MPLLLSRGKHFKEEISNVFTKPITPPIIREEFDASKYRGVDKADIKAIHLALQNGEKLTIDRYGHIYTGDGRWIADGMQRG